MKIQTGAIRVTVLTLMAALGISACGMPNRPMTEATAAETRERLSDGEVLQVVRTINRGEITLAQLALEKSDDPRVIENARHILKDHTASNQKIEEVADTTDTLLDQSRLSSGLEMQVADIREELAGLSDEAFNRRYLEHQAVLHNMALSIVENRLLPSTQEERIASLLRRSTPTLEAHLEEVQQRQASMGQPARG